MPEAASTGRMIAVGDAATGPSSISAGTTPSSTCAGSPKKPGKSYRLPSEAEWEYAARAGTTTSFGGAASIGAGEANCRECGSGSGIQTVPVGSFKANSFGLYDTAGNVAEWVEDCWNDNYRGAPQNGSAWTSRQCTLRVLRGGAFDSQARYLDRRRGSDTISTCATSRMEFGSCASCASARFDELAPRLRDFGALPSPLWGGVGGGGPCVRQH